MPLWARLVFSVVCLVPILIILMFVVKVAVSRWVYATAGRAVWFGSPHLDGLSIWFGVVLLPLSVRALRDLWAYHPQWERERREKEREAQRIRTALAASVRKSPGGGEGPSAPPRW